MKNAFDELLINFDEIICYSILHTGQNVNDKHEYNFYLRVWLNQIGPVDVIENL